MKITLNYLISIQLFFLICSSVHSQTIKFSDTNFEQFIIENECALIGEFSNREKKPVDQNGDKQIDQTELERVHTLVFNDCAISDFSDLRFFRNLLSLEIKFAPVVSLDLSVLPRLRYINVDYNILEQVNLDGLDSLYKISCSVNMLEALKIPDSKYLTSVRCESNLLRVVELGNLPKLDWLNLDRNLLDTLDLSKVNNEMSLVTCRRNRLSKVICPNNCQLNNCNGDHNRIEAFEN